MSEKPCSCKDDLAAVSENLGMVNDTIRAAVQRAPFSRSVTEVLKQIKVKFKVEVKRWDPKHGKYKMQRDPKTDKLTLWLLHYDSEAVCLDDLLTKGGRDLIHNAAFMTGVQPAALTFYAVCNPASFSPADTDTTLNTEITTPTQMARHQCTGSVDGVTESFTHTGCCLRLQKQWCGSSDRNKRLWKLQLSFWRNIGLGITVHVLGSPDKRCVAIDCNPNFGLVKRNARLRQL